MNEFFDEVLVNGLNVAAQRAMKLVKVNLSQRLKERFTDAHEYQFGFTGFKGYAKCSVCGKSIVEMDHKLCGNFKMVSPISSGLVGQILVAIRVPKKPGRDEGKDGFAFWYVNVPDGYPNPYASGEKFDIYKKLYDCEVTAEDLVNMMQTGVDRLCKMLENAY